MDFHGVLPALLTPFDKQNRINRKELEKLIRYLIDRGASGFYVCGSTGEAFLMSTEERMEVMSIVRDCAPDHALIAQIGSIHEEEAMKLARHARNIGYHAISSVSPFYYKFTFDEIHQYYCRLADAAELPMLVYHIPALSGVNMGMAEISRFLEDERFMGIKYTSNDFFTMEQCKTQFPHKIVYNGYDEMFLCGLAMGADGGIGSTYNFMVNKFVSIRQLFQQGKMEEAQKMQQEVNRIIAVLCRVGVMQAEKEVLNQLGFHFGCCRRPFAQPTEEQKALIAKEILPFIS